MGGITLYLRHGRVVISIMDKLYKVIGLFVAVAMIIFLPLLLRFIGVDEENVRLMYDYLDIILSFPAVILIIFSAILCCFKNEIQDFLKNISEFSYRNFQVKKSGTRKGGDEEKVLSEGEQVAVETRKKRDEEIEKLEREYSDLLEYYYFKYLDVFLIHDTKKALFFFRDRSFSANDFFNHFFLHRKMYDHERQKHIMLDVLLGEGLLVENEGVIFISEKGKRFLKFIDR